MCASLRGCYQAAEAFGRAGDAADCDRAYRSAFERLPESSLEARSFLWRTWAEQFLSRHNWPEAEKAYRESLAVTSENPDLPVRSKTSEQTEQARYHGRSK